VVSFTGDDVLKMVVDSGNNLDYSFWQCSLCMFSIDEDQKREIVFLVCPYRAVQALSFKWTAIRYPKAINTFTLQGFVQMTTLSKSSPFTWICENY